MPVGVASRMSLTTTTDPLHVYTTDEADAFGRRPSRSVTTAPIRPIHVALIIWAVAWGLVSVSEVLAVGEQPLPSV